MSKRKGIRHFNSPRVGVITQQDSARLAMPIHAALTLIPAGLYTADHAHDLAAFLTVGQVAAREAKAHGVVEAGANGAGALRKIKERADADGKWLATEDELSALMRAVTAIDGFQQRIKKVQFISALRKVYRLCEAAEKRGMNELDVMEDAA